MEFLSGGKSRNSLSSYALQVVNNQNNFLQLLTALEQLSIGENDTVQAQFFTADGETLEFTLPSIGYLENRIDALQRSLNSLAGIGQTGALIEIEDSNVVRKVFTADLNIQPNTISTVPLINNFYSQPNYFLENLLNPLLQVELDLSGRIRDNVDRIISRRYVLRFEVDSNGQITAAGEDARIDFVQRFKDRNDIELDDFVNWSRRSGIQQPVIVDEETLNLEPNNLQFAGNFDIIRTELTNQKLYWVFGQLEYFDLETGLPVELKVGDELIVNSELSNTVYRVREIVVEDQTNKVDLERVDGNNPIPVANGALRIYSPVIQNQKVRVSISFNEYNVIFVKAINQNRLQSEDWSGGIAFFTGDLTFVDEDGTGLSGQSLQQYYLSTVQDYGKVLSELVQNTKPVTAAQIPNAPEISADSFAVRQINNHLTNNPNVVRLRKLQQQKTEIKSQIEIINNNIENLKSQTLERNFKSEADRNRSLNEVRIAQTNLTNATQRLSSTVQEIRSLQTDIPDVNLRWAVEGYVQFPEPVTSEAGEELEVVQFKVRYKYASLSGQETQTETFQLGEGSEQENAVSPQWVEILTEPRKSRYNPNTGKLEWQAPLVSDTQEVSSNFIRVSISPGEKVILQVAAISEVGYPQAPLQSDWSNQIEIEFPEELAAESNLNSTIFQQAIQDEAQLNFQNILQSRGIIEHVERGSQIGNIRFYHESKDIITNKIQEGNQLNLQQVIDAQDAKIAELEAFINRIKGNLKVFIRKGEQEFELRNTQSLRLTYNLFEFAEKDNNGGPGDYINRFYELNDSLTVILRNVDSESPLGIISYRTEEEALGLNSGQNTIRPTLLDDNSDIIPQQSRQFLWVKNRPADSTQTNYIDFNNTSITPDTFDSKMVGYNGALSLTDPNIQNTLLDVKYATPPTAANSRRFVAGLFPVLKTSNNFLGNSSDEIFVLGPGEELEIPIKAFFCLDTSEALDESINFNDSRYINHQQEKNLTFIVEPENQNSSFEFGITLVFDFTRPKSQAGFGKLTRTFQLSRKSQKLGRNLTQINNRR